jgi:hypothetical protein
VSVAELIKDYGPPVAWIVAVFGLIYNNYTANKREKRKEVRSEIDSLAGTVKDALKKLSEYYKPDARGVDSKKIELELKVIFNEIDLKMDRLVGRRFKHNVKTRLVSATNAAEKFYDRATSGCFESDAWAESAERQKDLHESNVLGLLLIESLHAVFLSEFDSGLGRREQWVWGGTGAALLFLIVAAVVITPTPSPPASAPINIRIVAPPTISIEAPGADVTRDRAPKIPIPASGKAVVRQDPKVSPTASTDLLNKKADLPSPP